MRRLGASTRQLGFRAGGALALACWLCAAAAQEVPSRQRGGRGEMTFTYQYQEAQDLESSLLGTLPSAPITTHLLDFDIRYAVNERWTVSGGLPLISRKWEGPPSHDPMLINPPHPESDFVDDGDFHTYFQDLRLGASYLVLTDPVIVEPYIELGVPSTDYPFLAASAVGQNLKRAEIGTTIAYRPPFLKWFFALETGYVFVEEPIGINVNTTRVDGEAVYFVNPRISVNVFFSSKNGKGLAVQPVDRTTEAWYHHDQTTRHNYVNAGLGMDWALSGRNRLNATIIRMVHAEDVFDLNEALSLSLSRSF